MSFYWEDLSILEDILIYNPEYYMDDEAGKSDRSERKELSQLYNISKLYLFACNLPVCRTLFNFSMAYYDSSNTLLELFHVYNNQEQNRTRNIKAGCGWRDIAVK